MKKFWVEFIKRGCLFSWCGPVVMCIVWACLYKTGTITSLDVMTIIREVLSVMLVAFIAAGVTAVHQQEQLPRGLAFTIHMAVLYLDYLVIYLINGWLRAGAIWIFTLIFFVCFAIIWIVIFLVNRRAVNRMNMQIGSGEND